MSRFRVLYQKTLVDDLTDRWLAADAAGERVLEELTTQIDHILARRPLQTGALDEANPPTREWRFPAFNGRVRVRFQVFSDEEVVRVSLLTIQPTED